MLKVYQAQVDISDDGLRVIGLGRCSSRISWSLPQYGHFNVLPVIGGSSFSILVMGRPDSMAAKRMRPANVLTWLALDLCQIP
jgi:hypothetical protein